MSILMTCKEACPYIYQVVSRESPFAAICLEKELTRITELYEAVRWSVKYFLLWIPDIPEKFNRRRNWQFDSVTLYMQTQQVLTFRYNYLKYAVFYKQVHFWKFTFSKLKVAEELLSNFQNLILCNLF